MGNFNLNNKFLQGNNKLLFSKPLTTNIQVFSGGTSGGTWTYTVPAGTVYIEYVIIAGGGAGGINAGGGGGAGGYRSSVVGEYSGKLSAPESVFYPTAATYQVIVGSGGTISTNTGGNSSVFGIIALGGGKGGAGGTRTPQQGYTGGCGGGSTRYTAGDTTAGGLGTANQGFDSGTATRTSTDFCSAGGGGAGGKSPDALDTGRLGTVGGAGITTNILGTPKTFASGGSGDAQTAYTDGGGGSTGHEAVNGTGGGGRGYGGVGGSGLVILKAYIR